jgi:hypothetical protein
MLPSNSRGFCSSLPPGVLVAVLLACSSPSLAAGNLNIVAHQARLTLQQPPARSIQVLDLQKQLVAAKREPGAAKTRDVVVTGRIGGMPNVWPETHPDFPWYEGQASFFLVDLKMAAQFAAHARQHGGSHQCAFCKGLAARNAHAIAVVNFVDEQGQVLRVAARQLLGLEENQTVTVRGKARLLAGRMLVIDADGVYVER